MSDAPSGTHTVATPSLVALQAASQALARARVDEEGVLEYLQEQVHQLLPPGRIHVLLFFEDQTRLYAWNRKGEPLPGSYFDTPAAQGIMGWLRETRESLLVGDFQRDWDYLPARPSYENPHPPRSAMFVPLVVADEALGAISVQSDQPDVFSPDHLWQLKILANQAAAALSSCRLLRSERLRANQLETLAEVTRSVVSILDIDALLTHVVEVIEQRFGYYHVQVFLVDEGTNRAVFRASSEEQTHALWRKMGRQIGQEGIIGWVLANGEVLVAPDVSIDPLYIPDDPHLLPDTRSEVAIPLRLEDKVLGVLDIQSDRLDAFAPDDLFILNALADAVALAAANAQLYARVQEDAWITVALLEVADATNRLTELADVVETIARITPLLTGVVACAIWLRDPESGRAARPDLGREFLDSYPYRPAAQWGLPEETIRFFFKLPLLSSENPALLLVEQTQQPQVLRPPRLDEMLSPIVGQALLADAVVMLPLLAMGHTIGVMAVSIVEENGPLSEKRVPLLKGIADQTASAIQNAQLIAAQREEAWVSTALLQVAEAMGRARDLPETLDAVARLTTTLSGLDRCTILLRQGQSEQFIAGLSYTLNRNLPTLPEGEMLEPDSLPLLGHLLRQRLPVVLPDARASDLFPAEMAEAMNLGAVVALPLVANDVVVGAMLVDEVEAQRVGNARLLDILNGIANQAAVAIERARMQRDEIERQRFATELSLAHNIQKGFLPEELPDLPGYEIAALWEPARQIGGDFYDFIPLADGRLGVIIADVADKGIPAALYMALSRTTMRMVAGEKVSPATALQRVNSVILDTSYSDLFVTIYYAILDPQNHEVCYASGGHGLAMRVSNEGATFLRGKGTALGILPTIHIEEHGASLAAGDYYILYTDGVTDAVNEAVREFGEQRLVDTGLAHRGASAEDMLNHIHTAVRAWQGDAPPFDDFTLVVVRRAEA